MAISPFQNFDDIFFNTPLNREIFKSPFYLPVPRFNRKITPSFDIDMVESESSYSIHADIPGVNKEDINVSIDGGYLTISAERSSKTEKSEDCQYHFSERSHGTFTRNFPLPDNVNSESLRAKYENGVLEITLNKIGKSTRQVFKID
jgi:HSP20 family protein